MGIGMILKMGLYIKMSGRRARVGTCGGLREQRRGAVQEHTLSAIQPPEKPLTIISHWLSAVVLSNCVS